MPISGNELLVLLVLAALLIGPERLPRYAEQLAGAVRRARALMAGATRQLKAELGPEFDDVDWSQFDPRRYDPRRIVQEALLDEPPARAGPLPQPGQRTPGSLPAPGRVGAVGGAVGGGASRADAVPNPPVPFDDEAT